MADQLRLTVDGDELVVDVLAWDRVAAERQLAAAGRPIMKHPVEMGMAVGYFALMRTWHGAKRSEYEPYEDMLMRLDVEDVESAVDPTDVAQLLAEQ